MKKGNKGLIAIIVVLTIIVGISKCSFNRSTLTISTYEDYNRLEKGSSNFDKTVNFENFTINIENKKTVNDSTFTEKIKADVKLKYIKDTHIGWGRFIPFYKHVNFKTGVNYTWKADVWKNGKDSVIERENSVCMKGVKTITGIVSAKKAKSMILKDIQNEVKKNVQREIEKQIKEIQ